METLSTDSIQMMNKEYMGADKCLARPGKKQATATEDIGVHTSISYLSL